MASTTIKSQKSLRGQKNKQETPKKKSGYIPVKKHSQKKVHPDTFVVGVRMPYKYYTIYKSLTTKDRNRLKEQIQAYFKTFAE